MEKIKAPWDGTNLITEFDWLADDGNILEHENKFAFFENGELVSCVHYENVLKLRVKYDEKIIKCLKSKLKNLESENENLRIEFVVYEIQPKREVIIVCETYWNEEK